MSRAFGSVAVGAVGMPARRGRIRTMSSAIRRRCREWCVAGAGSGGLPSFLYKIDRRLPSHRDASLHMKLELESAQVLGRKAKAKRRGWVLYE